MYCYKYFYLPAGVLSLYTWPFIIVLKYIKIKVTNKACKIRKISLNGMISVLNPRRRKSHFKFTAHLKIRASSEDNSMSKSLLRKQPRTLAVASDVDKRLGPLPSASLRPSQPSLARPHCPLFPTRYARLVLLLLFFFNNLA